MPSDEEQLKQLSVAMCKEHIIFLLNHLNRLDNPISTKQWLRELVELGIPKEKNP